MQFVVLFVYVLTIFVPTEKKIQEKTHTGGKFRVRS